MGDPTSLFEILWSGDPASRRVLWTSFGLVLAIALVIGAAMATLVLSLGTQRSLLETRDAYYERNRFAHVFASLKRAPLSLQPELAAIDGVLVAEARVVATVTLDRPPVNAITRSTMVELRDTFRTLGDDPDVRVAVFTARRA